MNRRLIALLVLTVIIAATLVTGYFAGSAPRTNRAVAPALPVEASAQVAHLPFGPIRPPRAMPKVGLLFDDGKTGQLDETLKGHWTLAQLMFAGCTTTCPIQGAIFQQTSEKLSEAGLKAELLSLSIDPISDDPAALTRWLKLFEARANWRAAAPALADLGPLVDSLQGRGRGIDIHDARVYLFNPAGELIFASEDLPDPTALVAIVRDAQEHM